MSNNVTSDKQHREGALVRPLPALNDIEGACVPAGLPPVIDAHVHVFPAPLMKAVHRWFESHEWPIRYKMDTTMMLAGYFPNLSLPAFSTLPEDRVLYGTDFCNLPYAWDRELRQIQKMGLPDARLEKLLAGNARELLGLP